MPVYYARYELGNGYIHNWLVAGPQAIAVPDLARFEGADWKQQDGAAYSLQRFHDELLRHGMPPIRLLREAMLRDARQWAEIF